MIDKVGGIIVKDKKIVVQRKKNNREECIIPGGKRKGEDCGASGGLCEGSPPEYGPHRRQLHHHDPGAAGEDAEDPAAVLGGK